MLMHHYAQRREFLHVVQRSPMRCQYHSNTYLAATPCPILFLTINQSPSSSNTFVIYCYLIFNIWINKPSKKKCQYNSGSCGSRAISRLKLWITVSDFLDYSLFIILIEGIANFERFCIFKRLTFIPKSCLSCIAVIDRYYRM